MKAFVAILAAALFAIVLVALTTTTPDADEHHDDANSADTAEAKADAREMLADAPRRLHRDEVVTQPASTPTGPLAADFELPLGNGKTVRLSDLRGNVVVLDFWAVWCGPCMAVLPHVDALNTWAVENDQPIKVFAVHTMERKTNQETIRDVARLWATKQFDTLVLFDFDSVTAGRYGVSGIPHTLIIGPDGHIVAEHRGFVRGRDMTATLKQDCLSALGGR